MRRRLSAVRFRYARRSRPCLANARASQKNPIEPAFGRVSAIAASTPLAGGSPSPRASPASAREPACPGAREYIGVQSPRGYAGRGGRESISSRSQSMPLSILAAMSASQSLLLWASSAPWRERDGDRVGRRTACARSTYPILPTVDRCQIARRPPTARVGRMEGRSVKIEIAEPAADEIDAHRLGESAPVKRPSRIRPAASRPGQQIERPLNVPRLHDDVDVVDDAARARPDRQRATLTGALDQPASRSQPRLSAAQCASRLADGQLASRPVGPARSPPCGPASGCRAQASPGAWRPSR